MEIVTDKNKTPNPFWISFVKTLKAKNHIKAYLKKENKDENIERGRELLNKHLERVGLSALDKDMILLKHLDDRVHTTEDRLNILEQVGNFSVTASSLMRKILRSKNIKQNIREMAKHPSDFPEDEYKVDVSEI